MKILQLSIGKRSIFYSLCFLGVISFPYIFAYPGIIHTETMTYSVHYLDPAKSVLEKVFDPANAEGGSSRSRELSYLFNWLDVQALNLFWPKIFIFFPISHLIGLILVFLSLFWITKQKLPVLSTSVSLSLYLLLLSSTNFFWSSVFLFRSGNILQSSFLFILCAFVWGRIVLGNKFSHNFEAWEALVPLILSIAMLIGLTLVSVFPGSSVGFGKLFYLSLAGSVIALLSLEFKKRESFKLNAGLTIPIFFVSLMMSLLDRMGIYNSLVLAALLFLGIVFVRKNTEQRLRMGYLFLGLVLAFVFMVYYDQKLGPEIIESISGYYPMKGIPSSEMYLSALISWNLWLQAARVSSKVLSSLVFPYSTLIAVLLYLGLVFTSLFFEFRFSDKTNFRLSLIGNLVIPFSMIALFVLMCSWVNIGEGGLLNVYYMISMTSVFFLQIYWNIDRIMVLKNGNLGFLTSRRLELGLLFFVIINISALPSQLLGIHSSMLTYPVTDSQRLVEVLEHRNSESEAYRTLSRDGKRFIQAVVFQNFEFGDPFLFRSVPIELDQLIQK